LATKPTGSGRGEKRQQMRKNPETKENLLNANEEKYN